MLCGWCHNQMYCRYIVIVGKHLCFMNGDGSQPAPLTIDGTSLRGTCRRRTTHGYPKPLRLNFAPILGSWEGAGGVFGGSWRLIRGSWKVLRSSWLHGGILEQLKMTGAEMAEASGRILGANKAPSWQPFALIFRYLLICYLKWFLNRFLIDC